MTASDRQTGSQRANDPVRDTVESGLRGALGTFARQRLPEAMVPTRFVMVDELPKLPNGKVDRGRLLEVDNGTASTSGYAPPTTVQQTAIAQIWAEELGVGRVGVATNFFDLGGDSITAARVVARMRDELGVPVTIRRLFAAPTVTALAGSPDIAPLGDRANARSLAAADVSAEAVLPADVTPGAASPASRPPYRRVLLTGGTGYTGAFLLRALLERGDADVSVLVRADTADHGVRRVRDNLSRYGLWREKYQRRLTAVPGDLSRPYLGLDRSAYLALAGAADLIVHNGALSSYALPYHGLKASNVLGTVEVLRLACRTRIKPVHFISSLAVFPGHRGAHHYPEAELVGPDGVVGGYRQTKWVADKLVTLAAGRGLPVCVYRPGQITGAQDTGACAEDTFLNAMIKGCVQLGAAPRFDVRLEMTPVDLCAAVVAHVALSGGQYGSIFHVPGARSVSWDELAGLITDHGYRLRALAYPEWYRELTSAVRRGEPNELVRFLPLFDETSPAADLGYEHAVPAFGTANLRGVLDAAGIEYRPVDAGLAGTYLNYFISTGYLPEPARRPSTGATR